MSASPTDDSPDDVARSSAARWHRAVAWLVFLAVLGVHGGYAWRVRTHPGEGYGHFNIVRGAPYADARSWHDMGEDLAEGRRFQIWRARRPAYAIFLGVLYTLFGPHYDVALAANVFCQALIAAAVYVTLGELFGGVVAICVTLATCCTAEALSCSAVTLSEPLGLALLVVHFRALVRGVRQANMRRLAISGLWFGLSNATRTLTLLAWPGYVVLIAWLVGRRAGWRRAVACTAAFGATGAAVVLAFMLWNYQRNGMFTLSDNTVFDLYAVSSPEFGVWFPRVEQQLTELGLQDRLERYQYASQRVRENIRANPEMFAGRVATYLEQATTRVSQSLAQNPWLYLGLWLAVAQVLGTRPWRGAVAALFLAVAQWQLVHSPGLGVVLVVAATLWGLLGRPRAEVSLLASLFAFTMLAVGMFGSMMERLFYMFEWAALALVMGAGASWIGVRPARGYRGQTAQEIGEWAGGWTLPAWLRYPALAVFAVGAMAMLWRNLDEPIRQRVIERPATDIIPQILAPIAARHPELFSSAERRPLEPENLFTPPGGFDVLVSGANHGRLTALYGWIEHEPFPFPAGVSEPDDPVLFAARPYARTAFDIAMFNPDRSWASLSVMATGDIAPLVGKRVLVVGRVRWVSTESIVEAIAVCPFDVRENRFDPSAAISCVDTPGHAEVLQKLVPRDATSAVPRDEAGEPDTPAERASAPALVPGEEP